MAKNLNYCCLLSYFSLCPVCLCVILLPCPDQYVKLLPVPGLLKHTDQDVRKDCWQPRRAQQNAGASLDRNLATANFNCHDEESSQHLSVSPLGNLRKSIPPQGGRGIHSVYLVSLTELEGRLRSSLVPPMMLILLPLKPTSLPITLP